LFEIVAIYIFAIRLLSKQTISIASNSNIKLLNKTFRFLLIIVTIVLKINFYTLRTIYRIY